MAWSRQAVDRRNLLAGLSDCTRKRSYHCGHLCVHQSIRGHRLQVVGSPHQTQKKSFRMKKKTFPSPWTPADTANSYFSRFLGACQVIARNRLALLGVVIVGPWLLTVLFSPIS